MNREQRRGGFRRCMNGSFLRNEAPAAPLPRTWSATESRAEHRSDEDRLLTPVRIQHKSQRPRIPCGAVVAWAGASAAGGDRPAASTRSATCP